MTMSPGIQSELFIQEVNPDFICSICFAVLYDPNSTPCDHHFCSLCIRKWLKLGNQNCPTCRYQLTANDLKPISRIVSNILNKLRLRCPNQIHGCQDIITYQNLEEHESICLFDSSKWVKCSRCKTTFRYGQAEEHMKSCMDIIKENESLRLRTTRLEFERDLYRSLMALMVILCVIYAFQPISMDFNFVKKFFRNFR